MNCRAKPRKTWRFRRLPTLSAIPNGWTDVTSTLNTYFPLISTGTTGELAAGDTHSHTVTSVADSCFGAGGLSAVTSVTSPTGNYGALKPNNVKVRAIYRTS